MNHSSKIVLMGVGAVALLSMLFPQFALAQSCGLFDTNCGEYRYDPPNLAPIRTLIIVLSGALGFGIGWFLSPQAKEFRSRIAMITMLVLIGVAVIDNGLWGWGLTPVAAMMTFVIGFGYWMAAVVRHLVAKPTTFGSAEWAKVEELEANNLLDSSGFRLGHFKSDLMNSTVFYPNDRHLIVSAPSRSGKGTNLIIPNLLTYEGSILVIDPKGENAMITAERRRIMGQDVHIVDPWGITGMETSRFNPLDWLVKGDIDLTENAMILADALIVPSNGNEQFWDEEAKALIQGVIVYVVTHPYEDGNRTLARVRDLLLLDGKELIALFKRMLESEHHIARSTGARCLQKEEKLLANVLASVQAQTHFLDSARIRENLSASDFKFEDLKVKPMTIYLVLPSDRLNTFGRWLRLLIQQALTVNARNIEIKPEKPVLFILDEMAALGRLTMVEQAFGLMAGYSLQILAVVQDLSQLKRIYGDGWETFISNAGAIAYYGSRDRMTAEYFSALCGETTVWDIGTGISRAVGHSSGQGGPTKSETTTSSETTSGKQRKLAYPDELMRMHKSKQLLLIEDGNPILAQKLPWFDDPDLKDLGVNLHVNAD